MANSKVGKAKIIIGVTVAVIALIAVGVVIGLFIFNSANTISDIKSADFVGKTVSVSGTVKNSIKIGSLSGTLLGVLLC